VCTEEDSNPIIVCQSNTRSQCTTQASQKARTELEVHEQVTKQYSISTDDFEINEHALIVAIVIQLNLCKQKLQHYHCR